MKHLLLRLQLLQLLTDLTIGHHFTAGLTLNQEVGLGMLMPIKITILNEYLIGISKHLAMIFPNLYPTLPLLLGNSLLFLLNNLIQLLYPPIVLRNVGQHLVFVIDPLLDEFVGCE